MTYQQRGAFARAAAARRKNRERDRRIVRQHERGVPVARIASAEGLARQTVYNVLRANEAA